MDAWSESFGFSDPPVIALAQAGAQEREETHRDPSGDPHCALENALPAAFHSQAAELLAGIAWAVLGD